MLAALNRTGTKGATDKILASQNLLKVSAKAFSSFGDKVKDIAAKLQGRDTVTRAEAILAASVQLLCLRHNGKFAASQHVKNAIAGEFNSRSHTGMKRTGAKRKR